MKRHIIALILFIGITYGAYAQNKTTSKQPVSKVAKSQAALSSADSKTNKEEGIPKEWFALIAVGIGAILSTGGSFSLKWFSNRHEKSVERSKIKRENLIEIYTGIDSLIKHFKHIETVNDKLMFSLITLEQWTELIKNLEKDYKHFSMINLLIKLHCPEIDEAYNKFIDSHYGYMIFCSNNGILIQSKEDSKDQYVDSLTRVKTNSEKLKKLVDKIIPDKINKLQ